MEAGACARQPWLESWCLQRCSGALTVGDQNIRTKVVEHASPALYHNRSQPILGRAYGRRIWPVDGASSFPSLLSLTFTCGIVVRH